jgi:hypothetical protein
VRVPAPRHLLSPWVLGHALRKGWLAAMTASVLLWIAAQFGLSQFLYDALVHATGLTVPFRETGSFETFAWQFLWMFGLWLGSSHARRASGTVAPLPGKLVAAAIGIGALFFIWRHVTGQEPFALGHPLNAFFDKWHLGPMRLLDFAALLVLAMRFGPWLKTWLPRIPALETMGAVSLQGFCTHLVIVLLALALLGESTPARPAWVDVALFAVSLAAPWMAACAFARFEPRAGPVCSRRPTPIISLHVRENDGLPQRIARAVHVQFIIAKQLMPGLALCIEHGGEHIDELPTSSTPCSLGAYSLSALANSAKLASHWVSGWTVPGEKGR